MFGTESKFFRFMGKVADLIILNIVCVIFCLPIVTIGPALTALSYMTQKMVRDEESYIIRGFWNAFKQNFRQGLKVNIIVIAVSALLGFNIDYIINVRGREGFFGVLYYVTIVLIVLWCFILLYLYPVMSKFENTIGQTFKNSFLMSFVHLPDTIIMAIITVGPPILMYMSDKILKVCMFIYLIMGISLLSYLKSMMFVGIFDHYIPKEEKEETEEDTETAEEL